MSALSKTLKLGGQAVLGRQALQSTPWLIEGDRDEDTMRLADYLVDFGPGAGQFGGQIVSHGTP